MTIPTMAAGGEKRSAFGRFLRWFLEPVYYWVDLKGPDRRPSFTKLVGLLSFVYGLVLLFRLWGHYFHRADNGGHPGTGELGFLLAFSFLVFLLPYGIKGLSVWAATRGGGSLDLLKSVADREPERLTAQATLERARAEIGERRRQGGGDHEVTP